MGTICAVFQYLGKIPVVSDLLKMVHKGEDSSRLQLFTKEGGMRSGPAPFSISRNLSLRKTSDSLNEMADSVLLMLTLEKF